MIAYSLHVQLADHEWGHDLMRQAAREAFARYEGPESDLMVVQVGEHAGWDLTYLRDGSCVGTANVSATSHLDHIRAFNARTEGATWILPLRRAKYAAGGAPGDVPSRRVGWPLTVGTVA